MRKLAKARSVVVVPMSEDSDDLPSDLRGILKSLQMTCRKSAQR